MAKGKKLAYDYLTPKQKRMILQDLPRKLKDPNNPAGNYKSPGGPVFDVNKMKQVKGGGKNNTLKIAKGDNKETMREKYRKVKDTKKKQKKVIDDILKGLS